MELKDIKNAPTETLDKLAWNVNTSADVLTELARNKNESIRKGVAWNPNTPAEVLKRLANEVRAGVRQYVAGNKNTPAETLTALTEDVDNYVSQKAAETLEFLAKSEDIYTKRYVAANPNTPAEVIERLLNDGIYNELPASKEETKLVNDLMLFYEDYDTYGFNDSTNGYEADFDETLSSIREPKSRSEIVNFLQSVIEDTADMANPTEMADNSRARQLIKDIAEYSCQIIEINADNTKSNIMEEKAMENQNTQQTQESTAKYFHKHSYGEIENKAFISCDAKTAYAIGQKAQEQGITFSAKYDGDKSSIVVDGVKDKAFVDAVKAEFKVHTADDPTFFNSRAYKDIENKAFLSCDAKTAYAIGQKAQEQGVTFSAKYDGDKSSIVVDGVKDKAFIDTVKAEFKVHTADDPTFFNKKEYKNIENKEFLNTDAKTAYAIGQKAQEQGITYSAKFDGNKSAVVVDGVKNKEFVEAVKAEFKVHTPDEPTFFNKSAYKDIKNKEFINTDAKTAYAIGQKAQQQGITFSAKFDGDNSAVTVDGVENKEFVEAVKAEFNIVDKINDVEDIADKIQDAIDNGELNISKDEQSISQER